jgi:hypothetical protein
MEEQPMLEHKESELGVAENSAPLKSALISFDPDQILRAICFHLLDDGHARSVAGISVYQMRDRFRRQRMRLMIARRQWEEMKNRERLEWLLAKSKTVTIYSGQIVSLAPQR